MVKNVMNLTRIFSVELLERFFVKKDKNGKKKRPPLFWLFIFVIIGVSFLSYKIIEFLLKINQQEIFLNIYFLFLSVIIIFQVIMASSNVYYFSSDLESILPLPIKPIELLIAKFNTIMINMYFSEMIFALFPIIIYGIMIHSGILFYLYAIIILMIFPALPILIISIIMMILIKFSKFMKNKDIFQILITVVFISLVFFLEFKVANNLIGNMQEDTEVTNEILREGILGFNQKITNVNKYLLQLNPIINALKYSKISSILNIIKVLLIDVVFFSIFTIFGKITYLKDILKSNSYNRKNKVNNVELKKVSKKINKKYSYIKKEFKTLFKNPTFFIQSIFPTFILMVTIIIIMLKLTPGIRAFINSELMDVVELSMDISMVCLILGVLQMIFTLSNISITSISREGKNVTFMKTIPLSLQEQFECKSAVQIIINSFLIFLIIIFVKNIFPEINYIYLIYIFFISNLLNVINSDLMLFMDLRNPNVNWDSEYEVTKQNKNKIFQYFLTIVIILLLAYLSNIFSNINLDIACILIFLMLIVIALGIKFIIRKNINKLFNNIF